jgi:hypothetical protein
MKFCYVLLWNGDICPEVKVFEKEKDAYTYFQNMLSDYNITKKDIEMYTEWLRQRLHIYISEIDKNFDIIMERIL